MEQRDKWCHELSRGQTQRVVLAKTLLHRPRVLILDEPASGLDPLARRDLRNTLRRLAANGATVFVVPHILSELAEMSTSLCVMNRGRLLATGTADEVRHRLGSTTRVITITLLERVQEAHDWLSARHGVHDLVISNLRLSFGFNGDDEAQADLVDGLVSHGVRMRAFEETLVVRGPARRGRRKQPRIMNRPEHSSQPHDHPAWRLWDNPIFRRYCRSRLRLRGLSVALLITLMIAGFIVALTQSIGISTKMSDIDSARPGSSRCFFSNVSSCSCSAPRRWREA